MPRALPGPVRAYLARVIVADAGNSALRAIRARVCALRVLYKKYRGRANYHRLHINNLNHPRASVLYSAVICINDILGNYYARLYDIMIWPYRMARIEISARYGLPPRARWEAQPAAVQRP